MKQKNEEAPLWCLPYDTDSVFKPFLKIPFSTYLNNLISNEYFPAYQVAVARQLRDKSTWNQKCWCLVQYFQFLNQSFDIGVWDDHINFIQDTHLRNIMGFFRLWIDTERLYLLNFLKLDSHQFQQDRIFMCLFRTLLFFNNLFNEYMYNDFDPPFLANFINSSIRQMSDMSPISTNQTAEIIAAIIALLTNLSKREKILIELSTLQALRKSATIKVSKESQVIKEVQNRLKHSAIFKNKLDEEVRLRKIAKTEVIDEMTEHLRKMYDPIHKLKKEFEFQYYGPQDKRLKIREQMLDGAVTEYKALVKGVNEAKMEESVYHIIDRNQNNPYSMKNYQIFGQVVKIDMDKKSKYEKQKVAVVAAVDENDRSKLYYEQSYMRSVDSATKELGRVTVKDVNTSTKMNVKKVEDFKNQDQNTRVFNLKWHQDPYSRRVAVPSEENSGKDYDNNLLFKSPFEEQLLQNKRNNLDKLRDAYEVTSYTVALLEQTADDIYPDPSTYSQGATPFVKKMPQLLDTHHHKLVNHSKFDFMRKVISFMAAQKKIEQVIGMKKVPEVYPRHYNDVRQEAYNPDLQSHKVQFALGKTDRRPQLFL